MPLLDQHSAPVEVSEIIAALQGVVDRVVTVDEASIALANVIGKHPAIKQEEVRVDTGFVDDAELVVVAFGFPGRFVKYAVRLAREQGAGDMGMMGPGMHGMMDFGPMMEGRLAYTKAELGITDAQTAGKDVTTLNASLVNMNAKIADAKTTSQVLLCLSADSRGEVDEIVDKATSAGGIPDPSPVDEYDFMYGRSFEDPDGHIWEVMWMDPAAVTAG